jgi:hypothetical protein
MPGRRKGTAGRRERRQVLPPTLWQTSSHFLRRPTSSIGSSHSATGSRSCARPKVYLADPAIGPGVLLTGKALLEDADALGRAVETAFFKHVFTRYYARRIGFSFWRGKRDHEVDIIADVDRRLVPFEVKYCEPEHTALRDLKGMLEFCAAHQIAEGYVITRDFSDFKVVHAGATRLLKLPAPLACYWLFLHDASRDLDPRRVTCDRCSTANSAEGYERSATTAAKCPQTDPRSAESSACLLRQTKSDPFAVALEARGGLAGSHRCFALGQLPNESRP